MAIVPIQQVIISHDKNLALLGSAIEALLMTHTNKAELARVFAERCAENFPKMSQATDLDKAAFKNICNARDAFIKALTDSKVES